jgi:hypothetical protein
MDNTPVEEADQLNATVKLKPDFLFLNAMSTMWESISKAASSCAVANTGKHRFSGYPRESTRCRSCGAVLFRMGP